MKPNHYLIVANWKTQLPFDEALTYVKDHHKQFIDLGKQANTRIVLCPSFPALYPLKTILHDSEIYLGAQDCSPFKSGAYTGQVCAESLSQIECTYCIIGHSERRKYNQETNSEIADKAARLHERGIQPIICVGETKKEYDEKKTLVTLEQQLSPILTSIIDNQTWKLPFYIAYEPVWAIGTGVLPSIDELNKTFDWLYNHTKHILGKEHIFGLLYGGSISDQNVTEVKAIPTISGFLVGGASLDFQKFNNIVNLL